MLVDQGAELAGHQPEPAANYSASVHQVDVINT
jgi:hypothetical protein